MTCHMLNGLELPGILQDRILCRVPPPELPHTTKKSFVLYLPTVVYRKRHNPGFALACRLGNQHQLPVVVLCTVLDDQHLSRTPLNPVSMTARRLAFTLEAVQSCTQEWESHGAGVAIRVHGPGARCPDHLSLIHQASVVISDEPFVEPFRKYLRNIVNACQLAKVPCFSVDGSTTVPPKSKLKLLRKRTVDGDLIFTGVPDKAWKWEKQTEPQREVQVYGATKNGHLDAPDLAVKLPVNFFLEDAADIDGRKSILDVVPSRWKSNNTPCPCQRPWTVRELGSILDLKVWAMKSWPGADLSVPPCKQTHGSLHAAQERWEDFLTHGLKDYAKRRNQIVLPHAVSRISCYLNLGILSIFDVVDNVWAARSTRTGYSAGCVKYLDEVVKWREIGYVHTFASPDYHTAQALPKWAHDFFERQQQAIKVTAYTYQQLESAATREETWNAMQRYLIETGELHNNARMTWGKTAVHWLASGYSPADILWQLCTLNDRFALDGLSPPSYAGILWCFGWCDKPGSGGSVSTKPAHRYRIGPDGFEQGKESLFAGSQIRSIANHNPNPTPSKKARYDGKENGKVHSKSILSFFARVSNDEAETDTDR